MNAIQTPERLERQSGNGRRAARADVILPMDSPQATLAAVGGKGASLARLAAAGLPVPGGYHITTGAYRAFVIENALQPRLLAALSGVDTARPETLERAARDIATLFAGGRMPPGVTGAIAQAYSALPGHNPAVAVRSSATAEDLPEASFAGQQETYLNVSGAEAVLAAVQKCWASLWTARAIGYRARQGIAPDEVALAVVVQVLVPAEAAGILFTANPVTGRRDEALINAAWGLGEAVVGGKVTPDSLRVDKATGAVRARETADKQVMTQRTLAGSSTGTAEQPVPDALRLAPVLSEAAAAELARLGAQIEQLYGQPMDVEWALADGRFAILQARPITALPEPELPTPTAWSLPKGAYAAMRNNIVEMMGEPLSPLFATLGLSAVNASLQRVMTDAFGMRGIMPAEIIITVNQYAYFNGSLSLRGLARVLFGAIPIARQMFTGAVERWTEVGRPRYCQIVERWQATDWRSLSSTGLVDAARQLTEAAIDAYTALVSGVIPAAWISEALFTLTYDRLLKRRGDPPAPAYLLGFDSLPIQADKALYDFGQWARQHPALRDYLDRTPTPHLSTPDIDAPAGVPLPVWEEWQQRFRAHLQQFGHTLYDLDFAHAVPADDPTPVLDALKLYLRGHGVDPHARQQESARRRDGAVEMMRLRLRGWKRRLFDQRLAAAQKFAPLREDGLAEFGLAYPLIRQALRELGYRFVQRDVINAADDIYWLTHDEVRQAAQALDTGKPVTPLAGHLPQRQAEQRAARRASPPMALPQMKVLGFDLMSLKSRRKRGRVADVLTGVAASPGQVTAAARVLRGPEDFGQMRPGDVLVASITTPAWTPLFAMASAVVTDIGGPLSHGSIVAREYGLPAVLGTGDATRRLHTGDTVLVDGTAGKVHIQARGTLGGGTGIEWKPPKPKGQYMRGSIVDLMPDPLHPLFATLGLPAIGRVGIMRVMEPLTQSKAQLPDDYVLTINDYAYMGAAFTPRQWWWIITKMLLKFPRLIRMALPLWRDQIRPEYAATVARWQDKPVESLSAADLWAGAQELNDAAMVHLASLMVATTGSAAGAEMLFSRVYEKLIQGPGDPRADTFLMGYDSTPIQAEKSLYDLALWCRERAALADDLQRAPTPELTAQLCGLAEPGAQDNAAGDWPEFQDRFQRHLRAYGHLMYDLDYGKPLPLDDPGPMVDAIKMYLRGEGADPHARQHAAADRREQAVASVLDRVEGLRRWVFCKTLGMAQTMSQVRESALADIGLGYPALRRLLRELGRRCASVGIIAQDEDIFWLKADEAAQSVTALTHGGAVTRLAAQVAQRRDRHAALKQISPPPMLPPRKSYLGIDMKVFTPTAAESQTSQMLTGVAASAGRVTAPACVLHGPEDFAQMKPGAVLVAATTTPAWTPLFSMASAVVTDIGGPLSHGSIVAREYGLPAVMGTGIATRRIKSGQMITVDGTAGTVQMGGG